MTDSLFSAVVEMATTWTTPAKRAASSTSTIPGI